MPNDKFSNFRDIFQKKKKKNKMDCFSIIILRFLELKWYKTN